MSNLRLVSYNVKGINHPIKRKKILSQLKKYNCSIGLLQETHLSEAEHKKLRRDWVDQVFYASCPNNRKRGVAILIGRSISFAVHKEVKDKQGRYILVIGTIGGIDYTIMNIYAPNEDDPAFFREVASILAAESRGTILYAGDQNCVRCGKTDKLPADKGHPSKKSKALNHLLKELGLVDSWRAMNPKTKDFTFMSAVHGSYSRIDLICISKQSLHKVVECVIEPITLSDHAPVRMTLDLGFEKHFKYWRLNVSMLTDPVIKDQLKHTIEEYFATNDNGSVSPSMLWDGAKAVLRGKYIEIAIKLNKQRKEKEKQLESDIKRLEQDHKATRDEDILRQLRESRAALDDLLTRKAEGALRYTSQRYYEMGNRASRLLAFQLRKDQSSRIVPKIKHPTSLIEVSHPVKVAEAFQIYYKNLYDSPDEEQSTTKLEGIFMGLNLSKLTEEEAEQLTAPISISEIENTIKSLKNNKSPGTDGYPGEFYKTYMEELTPILGRVFNYTLQENDPPRSWSEAVITVIHKEGKDPLGCGSYRPISLLGNDVKILSSILANRIQKYLKKLINPDQTGFIPGRQGANNIRRALNIQSVAKDFDYPSMLLSLDAEKAFDRVDWSYLNYTMKRMGFNSKFIGWINTLNKNPISRVRVNGYCSEFFELKKGVRQGNPISPILFALSIEPLAELIRKRDQIEGIIDKGHMEHKISLFADDILLFIRNPASSIPALMQCLGEYGEVSGYKINEGKSEALMISGRWPEQLDKEVKFRWSKGGFRYLGVMLTHTSSQLYAANYDKLISQVKKDLERWEMLPLSLVGRVEAVKMNVLPRLLFLFTSLPVTVPVSTFRFLDKLISKFIWQNKRPRVRLKVLHAHKGKGGLALPNLRSYYWAAQLRILVSWLALDVDTRWVHLEDSSVTKVSLSDHLFLNSKDRRNLKINNEWVNYTLKVWDKIRKVLNLSLSISRATKIADIHDFIPAKLDSGFRGWAEKGLITINQLFEGTTLRAFSQLQAQYGIASKELFRYFQIRHYLRTHKEWDKIRKLPSNFEQFWIERAENQMQVQKIVSCLYGRIQEDLTENTLDVKNKWELEANTIISDIEWERSWESWHKCLSSPTWKEFSWKLRMRYFRTPLIISSYDKRCSSLCWRGCGLIGDLSHIFWDCPKLTVFWREVMREVNEIINVDGSFEPQQIILHNASLKGLGKNKKFLLNALVLIAHKMITTGWLKPQPPTLDQWTQRLKAVNVMECMTASLRLQTDIYIEKWAPVIMYLAK